MDSNIGRTGTLIVDAAQIRFKPQPKRLKPIAQSIDEYNARILQ